jgi:hypothetical protein
MIPSHSLPPQLGKPLLPAQQRALEHARIALCAALGLALGGGLEAADEVVVEEGFCLKESVGVNTA